MKIRSTTEKNKSKFPYLCQRHSNLYTHPSSIKIENNFCFKELWYNHWDIEVLQEAKSCCCNQIPWQQWILWMFLQWSPKEQTLIIYPHGSRETERGSTSQCWLKKEPQTNCEWVQSAQMTKLWDFSKPT